MNHNHQAVGNDRTAADHRTAAEHQPTGDHRTSAEHQPLGEHQATGNHRTAAQHQPLDDHRTTGEYQPAGDQTAHLSPEDFAAIQENLHEQRLFRQDQLRQIAAAPRAEELRGRRSAAQAEVHVKLAASARMVLADVEAALRRIAEGRYGVCHLCRRAIDRERLMVVPQARYCARCQQVREAGR